MKLKLIQFALFICFLNIISAQNSYYYYYKGKKINLQVDKTILNISTNTNFQNGSLANLNIKNFNIQSYPNEKFGSIEFTQEPNDL